MWNGWLRHQHKYPTLQWGETVIVRTWIEAVVLLLKRALLIPATLKAELAGEPWFGSVVVGGALPLGTKIFEDESGLPIMEPAEAGPKFRRLLGSLANDQETALATPPTETVSKPELQNGEALHSIFRSP